MRWMPTPRKRGRTRGRSVGKAASLTHCLAALVAIFLFLLWMVLLHHVAAHLFAGRLRADVAEERLASRIAAVLWRDWLDVVRLAGRLADCPRA